jgi:cell division protein FtsB
MDKKFLDDNFEDFLKETTDLYKMYPSDGVWTRIHERLSSGRKRITVGAIAFLFMVGTILILNTRTINDYPGSSNMLSSNKVATGNTQEEKIKLESLITKLRKGDFLTSLQLKAPKNLSPLVNTKKLLLTTRSNFQFQSQNLDTQPDLYPAYPNELQISAGNPSEITISKKVKPKQPSNTLTAVKPATTTPFYKLPVANKASKWEYQLHVSPTIGYRKLMASKDFSQGNYPLAIRHMNVNKFTHHQPAMGLELGASVRYKATNSLAFKTGLQINLSRYSIQATLNKLENTTVALNNAWGYRTDTIISSSRIRNISAPESSEIYNQYLQISIPIGAELKLFGDKHFQVNIAGSLLPSYLLNTNQYMLSDDLGYYVQEPDLIRRWNIVSSMEAYVAYEMNGLRWQIGPQVRYNILSSFKSQYPIRENLMQYGLKIGVNAPFKK